MKRITDMKRIGMAALATLSLVLGAEAQSTRDWSGCYQRTMNGDTIVQEPESNELEWLARDDSGNLHSGSVTIAADLAGAVIHVPLTREFLVTGVHSPTNLAFITRVALQATSTNVTAQVTTAQIIGADLTSLAFDSDGTTVYGFDQENSLVLESSYAPGDNLAAMTWTAILSPANCPPLANVINRPLTKLRTPIVPPGVWIELGVGEMVRDRYLAMEVAGTWTTTPVDVLQGTIPPHWSARVPEIAANHIDWVFTLDEQTGPFDIVRVSDGATVHSGQHTLPGSLQTFTLPASTLDAGESYQVVGGGMESAPIMVERKYMRGSLPFDYAAEMHADQSFSATGTSFLSWDLTRTAPTPPTNDLVLAVAAFGLWTAGTDPTAPSTYGFPFLAVNFGTLATLQGDFLRQDTLPFGYHISLQDPSIVGLRLAFQYLAILPGGVFASSDVAAVTLG